MSEILLVEDDAIISQSLSELLRMHGFEVITAATQKQALEQIENKSFDILLLDVLLPDGNGFALCRAAKTKYDVPVIFLTACTDEYSAVTGLDMGGDDYIEKPYRPLELISRIKSVLRRYGKAQQILYAGDVCVDTVKGTVSKKGKTLFLSALEYKLLLVFINNPGTVLTRNRLLSEIWDVGGDFVNDNTLTV